MQYTIAVFVKPDQATYIRDESKPFRVLSIDGGGMRGLYSAILLDELGRRIGGDPSGNPYDIGSGFDVITGTSTGAILACALALGVDTKKIIQFYETEGPYIFPRPMPKGIIRFVLWAVRHLRSPSANQDHLRRKLHEVLGDVTVSQVYNDRGIGICIPTLNYETQKPWVFKSAHFPEKNRDDNWPLVDICLSSSAAPVYLPMARCQSPDHPGASHYFVDGGLWANNPSIVGMIEALGLTKGERPIHIVSIGNCSPGVGEIQNGGGKWGLFQWRFGSRALEASMEAQSAFVGYSLDQVCSYMNGVTYCRLPIGTLSNEDSKHVALDGSGTRFNRIMRKIATADANEVFGKMNNSGQYQIAFDALSNARKGG